jgi:hypothetical protein
MVFTAMNAKQKAIKKLKDLRDARKLSRAPKSAHDLLKLYNNSQYLVDSHYKFRGQILVAYSKRLKGTNYVINNTLFTFDEQGYTCVEDRGNNRLDFNLLVALNGVKEVNSSSNSEEKDI